MERDIVWQIGQRLMTGFEGGMLGFALYPLLYGTRAPFAIVDMGQVFFVFSI